MSKLTEQAYNAGKENFFSLTGKRADENPEMYLNYHIYIEQINLNHKLDIIMKHLQIDQNGK